MMTLPAYFSFLEGSNYEIGRKQGEEIKNNHNALRTILSNQPIYELDLKEKKERIDEYCPGLNEEIQGFADALNVKTSHLNFYNETWLQAGGCSLGTILPTKTVDQKTYVLRNYDLSPAICDMRICTTKVKGRYRHTGFSVASFGRSEGLNEEGFCVAFASCGMPVGNHPGLKKPVTQGLQFMVIVRALLENCKDVNEAIDYVKDMPIAANMNLLLADANGNASLLETYDGKKHIKNVERENGFLIATNHAVIPEIMQIENGKLEHSEIRYNLLRSNLESKNSITKSELQQLLLQEYPNGLTVHNYNEHFGTVHSILFNLNDKQLDFSFGSPIDNEIYQLKVGEKLSAGEFQVNIKNNYYGRDFWRLVR